jgi:hypothetical protein
MKTPSDTIGTTDAALYVRANRLAPLELHCAGLHLTPLAGKNAILKGWPELHLSERQIRAWDTQGVNGGAVTGDDLIVLDTDTEQAEAWVRERGIDSPVTVRSGGGGTHRWFLKPENVTIIRCRNGMHGIKGLDVKGWHGLIVLPGSVHPETGRRYAFLDSKAFTALHDLPPFDLPWVREIPKEPVGQPKKHPLAAVGQSSGKVRDLMAYILSIPSIEGQNGSNAAYRVACLLYEAGKSFDEILAAMEEWNEVCAFPCWSREELVHKIESVIRRKAGQVFE